MSIINKDKEANKRGHKLTLYFSDEEKELINSYTNPDAVDGKKNSPAVFIRALLIQTLKEMDESEDKRNEVISLFFPKADKASRTKRKK